MNKEGTLLNKERTLLNKAGKSLNKPELLSPAGSLGHFKAAAENGADGIYFGGKLFNARQSAQNFSYEEMKEAIGYASLRDVKTYMTVNTLIKDDELTSALKQAEDGMNAGVTGFIVQDLGFAALLRERFPEIRLHLSTQGTVYNRQGAAFAERCGFKRVVLARELSEAVIRDIVDHTHIETELFVHGALCVCYSGQCMMSRMIGNRSGNRGSCAQPCRLAYELEWKKSGSGEMLKAEGYLLSPKDICLLEQLDRVIKLGVTSLKIEGRLKTPEYTALVTGTYRKYLDDAYERLNGRAGDVDGISKAADTLTDKEEREDLERLQQVFNRGGFTKGYFEKKYNGALLSGDSPKHRGLYLGRIKSVKDSGKIKGKSSLELKLERRLHTGDGIEVIRADRPVGNAAAPGGVISYIKGKGGVIKSAKRNETVWVGDVTGKIYPGDRVYKITDSTLMKEIQETYQGKSTRKSAVYGHFTAFSDGRAAFEIWDEHGTSVEVVSETPSRESRADQADPGGKLPPKERILAQLSKTGDTPFILKECGVELQHGSSLTIAQINGIRRTAFERFVQEKLRKKP